MRKSVSTGECLVSKDLIAVLLPSKVNLQCDIRLADGYKSACQIARVVTERWCARELYCPACNNNRLTPTPTNTAAVDFQCHECAQPFQVKSGKHWNEQRVTDAGYDAMLRSIRENRTPNLFILQYGPDWKIKNLLLIPRFFFSEAAVEKRPPLSAQARRAGWVGCNILLTAIPQDGKIRLVEPGIVFSPKEVRAKYDRLRSLGECAPDARSWTVAVLNVVRTLGKRTFSLADVYAFEDELGEKHPKNQHVRAKIRQQLQVLRDIGMLSFTARGQYQLCE